MVATGSSAPWPSRRRFQVTYHDVDALNHLNHAVYFQHMETLRCDYYLARTGSLDPRSLDIIIAEADCRYLLPAYYGTEMLGELAPARPPGRTSFVLLYRFTDPSDPSRVYARGRTVVVTFDYATMSKKPIPDPIRLALERDGIEATSEGWAAEPRGGGRAPSR